MLNRDYSSGDRAGLHLTVTAFIWAWSVCSEHHGPCDIQSFLVTTHYHHSPPWTTHPLQDSRPAAPSARGSSRRMNWTKPRNARRRSGRPPTLGSFDTSAACARGICSKATVIYRIGQEPPPQEDEAPYDPRSLYEVSSFMLHTPGILQLTCTFRPASAYQCKRKRKRKNGTKRCEWLTNFEA